MTWSGEGVKPVSPMVENQSHRHLNPTTKGESGVSDGGEPATAGTEARGEIKERIKELESALVDQWETSIAKKGPDAPRMKVPANPTNAEWEEHQVTHTPPKPWCKYCIMGRGIRRIHRHNVNDTEAREGNVNKISMDYMYLNDNNGDGEQPKWVVMDHNQGRIVAYSVPKKGVWGESSWVARRVARDLNNMGYRNTKIQVKSDQEPSIVALQEAIREERHGQSILANSPVGESECNGRAENAIRRMKEKVRTLIGQIEDGIGEQIKKGSAIIPWEVRWSAELLTKYAPGYDGKTPFERIKGERCKVPLAMFREKVMYLPFKTAASHSQQLQPRMKEGIWLGVIDRIEETIIGTEKGVVKCRTIGRFPEKQRWDKDRITALQGAPWSTVNGIKGDHIPVEINDDGVPTTPIQENVEGEAGIQFEEVVEMPTRPIPSGNKKLTPRNSM